MTPAFVVSTSIVPCERCILSGLFLLLMRVCASAYVRVRVSLCMYVRCVYLRAVMCVNLCDCLCPRVPGTRVPGTCVPVLWSNGVYSNTPDGAENVQIKKPLNVRTHLHVYVHGHVQCSNVRRYCLASTSTEATR